MRLNPVLAGMTSYPFLRLIEAKRAAIGARGRRHRLRRRRAARGHPGLHPARAGAGARRRAGLDLPAAEGLPELREAVAAWTQRRFGAALDPDTEVDPHPGLQGGDLPPRPGRGRPRRPGRHHRRPATRWHRAARCSPARRSSSVPLDPARGWQPDLEAVDWDGVALLWLNYPNNPTAATATPALYERAAALAREHDFVLASDEAYSELWFAGDPPVSALQLADRTNVVVFNTLSKRSSMPGYRSGFAAGDPEIIAALKRYRPNVGVAPQTFIQRAAAAAWADEEHVTEVRERYRDKRDALLPALLRRAWSPRAATPRSSSGCGCRATKTPRATRCACSSSTASSIAPGPYFGPGGEGHVRIALVPTPADCRRAADLLASGA